jgi:hypothetical protein
MFSSLTEAGGMRYRQWAAMRSNNMDQVVAQALKTYKTIREREQRPAEVPALLVVAVGAPMPLDTTRRRNGVRQ